MLLVPMRPIPNLPLFVASVMMCDAVKEKAVNAYEVQYVAAVKCSVALCCA